MATKRFVVFTYSSYDSGGGWNNKTGDFDTLDEARASLVPDSEEWYEIVDLEMNEVVESGDVPSTPREPVKGPWLVPAYNERSGSYCIIGALGALYTRD
jgi:hypothetical protein